MPLPLPQKDLPTLRTLLRLRLKEINRSAEELAQAAEVPSHYVDDLIGGRRRPPLPGRTDIYERMTTFLKLGRNELAQCARAERANAQAAGGAGPEPAIGRVLLALCEPATARQLARRRTAEGPAELAQVTQRLLDVIQGTVRRVLEDEIALRVAAARRGSTYLAMRFRVLEFLDATPETLTADDVAEFVAPRIGLWDVDLETGVLRVVLRTEEPRGRQRRAV
ncbi:MAG: hypothetical protein HYW52_10375 [Gemmatimonadetes bacterium]|nr:hypothetical protein [Gemmatimonadota bacterium]MBI2616056.1 hypothetical protein [Gemmatimonadota bacterium]